ncbi:phosphoribosyl-ATP diphosphatase [Brevibacterium paucivorans]
MKTFDELFAELQHKVEIGDPDSSTVKEHAAGVHAIGKKIVEEAAEVWMAAEHETVEEFTAEAAQLIYHVQVMMLAKGVSPEDVYKQL